MNREELKQLYKDSETQAGVYQIKNNQNQKIWISATRNLKTMNGKLFSLKMGSHINKQLQLEWNEYGERGYNQEKKKEQ
ncbi:hypothetical protein FB479_108104 [Brevibacillus sp. AG162]|uniref:GIY-YIG nuclease family protein n=1 Tax=Brevibacillus sp. AG162 TaxID=2572910 RepID=UPI00114FFA8A|nr:GIY-YIG nuclease family protein [Brevibacillus sp. AG162]TQK53889.1 hypothetical protein FB479_108104 [Brevibacillus sp. AG162]